MLKRHHGSSVELLPHDVIEVILERLSVKTLLRLRCVSKRWKTTIDSRTFQKQQLIRRRRQSGDADDVLFVCILHHSDYEAGRMRIVLGSQVICTVMLPFPVIEVCHGSCDGLLCIADFFTPNFVINPVTGWHQSFPYSRFQQLVTECYKKGDYSISGPKIGFGKDKLRGTYKAVWLYNSSQFGLDNVTTCEVFNFGTNAWRYLLPASPYRISGYHFPLYLDGSLYWFTGYEEKTINVGRKRGNCINNILFPCQNWLTCKKSQKGDVYGFGIVLLELFTGQKPLSVVNGVEGFKGSLVDWVSQYLGTGRSKDAIDRSISGKGHDEEILQFLKIACSCVVSRPKERPTMVQVYESLKKMGDKHGVSEHYDEFPLVFNKQEA